MTATLTAARVAVSYERVSKFKARNVDADIVRGTQRQAQDADEISAARKLGPVLHLAGDEGISASRFETRARGDWLTLLEMIRAGRVSVVLVWILDRIIRQTRDLDDLLDACRAAGATILQTSSGTLIHPDDPDSVAMAKIAGVLAETEVAKMSIRQRRKQRALVEAGKPHGGRRRFGYEPGMQETRESEARLIRKAADDILGGATLRGIAREWDAAGFVTPMGHPWSKQPANLGKMMQGAHLAGYRAHYGNLTEGTWPAILSRETWSAVCAVLSDPSRRVGQTRTRKYLLSGLAVCGECGREIRGRVASKGTHEVYICASTRHVHKPVTDVNEIVSAEIGAWLAGADEDGTLFSRDEGRDARALTDEADGLRARRKELAREFALAGDADLLREMVAVQDARLMEISQELASLARVPAVLGEFVGKPNARALFDDAPLDRQRAVLAAMPGRFVLNPNAVARSPYDPATVTVEWDEA